jgi:hypothetical protein
MTRHCFNLLLFLTTFISCTNTGSKVDNGEKDRLTSIKSDTILPLNYSFKNEQDYLKRKNFLCNRLALYDIEKGEDNFELRVWFMPSMWDPSILYILKAKDTTWTLFHYQFYTLRATDPNHFYNSPLVDSVVMESVRPLKTNWQTYINNLQLDSLWNLQTESLIKGKTFNMLDGHRYLLELSNKVSCPKIG